MRKINNDGVTLMSLVITIIVLLLLASIATYSGVNIVKQSKFTKFTTQLKMMQTQVNELYEKYSGNQSIEINGKKYTGTEIANIGKEISTLSQKNKVFNTSTSGITDSTGYKYYDKEIIKALNIDGLEEEEYFVNVAKRSVISYDGFEYNGKTYYTLEQLPDGLYNVEYSENTGKPTFDVNYECIEGGKYKITISNISYNGNIDKWQIKYQKEGQDYWSTSEDYNFVVNENGKYKIYIQNNNVISEEQRIKVGLEIGDTVTYTPSGTYKWEAEYCSSTKAIGTGDVTIDSSNNNYKISKWKVLDIKNGKVTLVPEAPTSGTVYLGQAQGYNNGVKLLNDACSNLYGNASKGIEARSINIEDIENYMTDDAKNGTNGTYKYNNGNATYNTQTSTPYTSSKKYPTIYAKENLSVINGTTNNNGLGMSEQTSLVGRTDESATDGKLEASTSIQPYQTYWYKDSSFMKTAFKTANNGKNYYDLLMPNGTSTYYWLASRCVNADSNYCGFGVRYVGSGHVSAYRMYGSYDSANGGSRELFPVVTLSSELLSGNATDGFTVK